MIQIAKVLQDKRERLEILEEELYSDFNLFNPGENRDPDSESVAFERIENYRSKHKKFSADLTEAQRAQAFVQDPVKAEFFVFIGEFDAPQHDFYHDKIQSFYKQFLEDESNLYFFVFEEEAARAEKDIFQAASSSMVKPVASNTLGLPGQSAKASRPTLYKLNAHSSRP
jgi:hypothetical protein